MKRVLAILIISVFCLVGCSKKDIKKNLSEKYNIGEEVNLYGTNFNIYKINDEDNELYLLAKNNIATTPFSDNEHSGYNPNVYEDSLVEDYVNEFVDDLEDKGLHIKSSGIIDKEDLYELGFEHSKGLSGLPYRYKGDLKFVKSEDEYWVGGYCKYQTRSWVYKYGILDTESCDDEYGIRPIIVISPSEVDEAN